MLLSATRGFLFGGKIPNEHLILVYLRSCAHYYIRVVYKRKSTFYFILWLWGVWFSMIDNPQKNQTWGRIHLPWRGIGWGPIWCPKERLECWVLNPKNCFTDTYSDGVRGATLTEKWLLNPLPSGSGSLLFISVSFSLLFLTPLSQVQSIQRKVSPLLPSLPYNHIREEVGVKSRVRCLSWASTSCFF